MKTLKTLLVSILLATATSTAIATSAEDSDQLFDQGVQAMESQDYHIAFQIWQTLSKQGNALAQFNLGALYYNRLGVKKNYQQAFKWYKTAAEQGHAEAQDIVSWLYGKGHGVKKIINNLSNG